MNDELRKDESVESSARPDEAQPEQGVFRRLSDYRGTVAAALLFLVVLFSAFWLTPIQPYATLPVDARCSLRLFSPDSALLVTAGKHELGCCLGPLRVWDVERGVEQVSMAHSWKEIEDACFSPDGSLLAAHEKEGDLTVWNAKTGEQVASFRPETRSRQWVDFRFSPDGQFIIFQDFSKGVPGQGQISFWNVAANRLQGTIDSYIWTLVVAQDGESCATFRQFSLPMAEFSQPFMTAASSSSGACRSGSRFSEYLAGPL